MIAIHETKKKLSALLRNFEDVEHETTPQEWASFFAEMELYFRSENIIEIIKSYKAYEKKGQLPIVVRCQLVLTSFNEGEIFKFPAEIIEKDDFIEEFNEIRVKIGGLIAMLEFEKDDSLIEQLDFIKNKSSALKDYLLTLAIVLMTATTTPSANRISTNSNESNAKMVDLNTILLPPSLVVTNIN